MKIHPRTLLAACLLGCLLAGAALAAGKPDKWQSVFRALNLDFEKKEGNKPAGWTALGGVEYVVDLDDVVVHGGKYSCRIRSVHLVDEKFGGIVQTLKDSDVGGQRIRFSGFMKWERVSGYASLWIRGDTKGKMVAFESQQSQKLNGTHDWQEYEVVINLPRQIDALHFGVLLGEEGEVWVDELKMEVITVDSDVQKRAAAEWIMLVDDGKYGESWKAAAKKLQGGTARVAWESRMNMSRKPLGKVVSRTWSSLQPGPQAQGPATVVLEAKTSFEKKPDAVETLTLMLDAGGVWKAAEYSIK